jgi:hypothetical protein
MLQRLIKSRKQEKSDETAKVPRVDGGGLTSSLSLRVATVVNKSTEGFSSDEAPHLLTRGETVQVVFGTTFVPSTR